MPHWFDRESVVSPGLEPADEVSGEVESKLDEVARGENRRVAVIANEDEPLAEAAEMPVPPGAVNGDPPFEHGPRDVHRLGDDAVKLASVLRANVDDDGIGRGGGKGVWSVEPGDPLRGLLEQTVK